MNQKPIDEIRIGPVKAAIWRNETDRGVFYNVTFQRLFKDEGEWRRTQSFGRDDLPLISKVADIAHTRCYELRAIERAEAEEAAR